MNAAEHFDWAIDRAMHYVENNDAASAMSSLIGDLDNHEGTADIITPPLTMLFFGEIAIDGVQGARRFISGLRRPAAPHEGPQT
jgi:hypothetical protein